MFGKIKSKFLEEAEEDKEDGICSCTGTYFVSVELNKFLFSQKLINYLPCQDLNPGPPR